MAVFKWQFYCVEENKNLPKNVSNYFKEEKPIFFSDMISLSFFIIFYVSLFMMI